MDGTASEHRGEQGEWTKTVPQYSVERTISLKLETPNRGVLANTVRDRVGSEGPRIILADQWKPMYREISVGDVMFP